MCDLGVGCRRHVLAALDLVRRLVLGQVDREPVGGDEQPAEDDDDDQPYSQCAHLRSPPCFWPCTYQVLRIPRASGFHIRRRTGLGTAAVSLT